MLGASRNKGKEDDIEARADSTYPPSHFFSHPRQPHGFQDSGRGPNETDSVHVNIVVSGQRGETPREPAQNGSKRGDDDDSRMAQSPSGNNPSDTMRMMELFNKDGEKRDISRYSCPDRVSKSPRQEGAQRVTVRDDRQSAKLRQWGNVHSPATNVRDFATASPSEKLPDIRFKGVNWPNHGVGVDKSLKGLVADDGHRRGRDQQPDRPQRSWSRGDVDHEDRSPRPGKGDYFGLVPHPEVPESRRYSQNTATYTPFRSTPQPAMSRRATRAGESQHQTEAPELTAEELLDRMAPDEPFRPSEGDDNHGNSFVSRLRLVYKQSLIDVSRGRVCVNFAEFNRVVLECAQKRLVEAAFDFSYGHDEDQVEECMFRAKDDLCQYVSAWKNLEFMTNARKNKGYDPFVVSTDYAMQRALLQDVEKNRRTCRSLATSTQRFEDMEQLTTKYGLGGAADKDNILPFGGGTRSSINRKEMIEEYTKKVAMAMIGAIFLVAPMLVMVLRPGLVSSLATTSVCVFTFGMVMSIFLEKPFDVLSGTAAYAAVLVVFIGTSGGT